MIYFDNAATSWPKPQVMKAAMMQFLDQVGANPGRSGHRLSVAAGRILYSAREAIAGLVNCPDPLRVVFTLNGTEALNLALWGLLKPGDHVITTGIEHNSVMRPLRALEKNTIRLTVVPCTSTGTLVPSDLEAAITENTKMIVLNQASNVVGTLTPVAQVGHIARQHGLLLLVDAAQGAGAIPIDIQAEAIDLLAFTGHKSLYGPTGTGGLVIGARVPLAEFKPLKQGGTGSRSEHEEQPDFLPDRFESGTANVVGLAGLAASVHWLGEQGLENIRAHTLELTRQLLAGLLEIPNVTVYGTLDAGQQTATVAFNINGMACSETGMRLDETFGIYTRVGLHCSPAAHKTIGTYPQGTVRFGLSYFNTAEQVEQALAAVAQLAQERQCALNTR